MKYHSAYLELTNHCNRQCAFCAVSTRPKSFLDPAVAVDWIDQIAPLAESIYWHVLGEPLLHPAFEMLARHAARRGLLVRLTTNAANLRRHWDFLLSGVVHQVNFSLQSLTQVSPEERERVWNDIVAFTRTALRQTPDLYLNFRWWQDAVPEVEKAALALDIPVARWQVPHGRYRKCVAGRLYATYDRTFQWPRVDGNSACSGARGGCHALTRQFAVLSDGTVTACCLDADGVLALGNAHKLDIATLLETVEAQRLREGFLRGERLAPLCRNCDFARRFNS